MITYLAVNGILVHLNPLTNQYVYTEVPSSLLLETTVVTTVDMQLYLVAFRFVRKRRNKLIIYTQVTHFR
jgi:hypothetical protein